MTAAWLGRFVTRAAGPIVWVSAIATIGLGVASTRLQLDISLERLQAQTRGAVLEQEVAARFSLPRDVLLVLNEHQDIEPLLETDARLERALTASAPSVVASGIGFLLPPAREQERVAQVIRASGTTSGDVQRDIRTAGVSAGFRPDTFVPFLERLPSLLDPDARISYDGLMAHGLESIVSRFIVRRDGHYQAVTYLYPQQGVDVAALRLIVRDVDPRLRLTGLPAINHELRLRLCHSLSRGYRHWRSRSGSPDIQCFARSGTRLLALLPTAVGFI